MRPEITVDFSGHSDDNIIIFRYPGTSSDVQWKCIRQIGAWLDKNNIEYYITEHSRHWTQIYIECEQAQVLVKLTFPEWTNQYLYPSETRQ